MTEALNVYQRMSKACKIIGSQAWVKSMENNQYKSIPIDDMRKGVREACVEAGLVHIGPINIQYERTTKDDRTYKIVGTCSFQYVNIDNPEEFIEYESMGEAMDNGDKCVGKFVTNLIKNHYKAAFDIGEQGKDDVDSYSNEQYYETDERIKAKTAKQDTFFSKRPEYKTEGKKAATPEDPEKAKYIRELTQIILGGGNDMEVVSSLLSNRNMDALDTEELKTIYDAVRPFPIKGGKA